MIKRSCGGESSSAARKRQATSAPLDEHPLVPSSQEHDNARPNDSDCEEQKYGVRCDHTRNTTIARRGSA
jgi:hypothetical protein